MEFLEQYNGPFYHKVGFGYGYFQVGCGNVFVNDALHQGVDWLSEEFEEVKRFQHNLIYEFSRSYFSK